MQSLRQLEKSQGTMRKAGKSAAWEYRKKDRMTVEAEAYQANGICRLCSQFE
jgi:hypothetical protein